MKKEISITIPTYNRPETLGKVIESYALQKYVKEVIIINDGSTSNYSEFEKKLSSLSNCYDIKYKIIKNSKNMGAAFSRNIGINNATGKYIFWGEDDAFLAPDYLEKLYKNILEKEIKFGAIYYNISLKKSLEEQEKTIDNQKKSKSTLFDYNVFEGYYRKKYENMKKVPFGHALILVPKKAYESINYFEDYKVNGYREETDAQVQMVRDGYKIYYDSSAECYHLPRNEIEASSGQHSKSRIVYEFYKIQNNYKFLKRHGSFLIKEYNLNTNIFLLNYEFIKKIYSDYQNKLWKKIRRKN